MPLLVLNLMKYLVVFLTGFLNVQSTLAIADGVSNVDKIMQDAYEAYHRYQDVVGAMRLYRSLAEQGYPKAQTRLGYILDLGEEDQQAILWYQKAAEQDEPEAQFYLGQHLLGDSNEDMKNTEKWWIQSAEQGYVPAMLALGSLYLERQKNRQVDATSWLQEAAQSGSLQAAERLVEIYRQGLFSIAVDNDKADYWGEVSANILSTTNKDHSINQE